MYLSNPFLIPFRSIELRIWSSLSSSSGWNGGQLVINDDDVWCLYNIEWEKEKPPSSISSDNVIMLMMMIIIGWRCHHPHQGKKYSKTLIQKIQQVIEPMGYLFPSVEFFFYSYLFSFHTKVPEDDLCVYRFDLD